MTILVLVAHPDDETIICGATIDKLVAGGHTVCVSFLTNNDQAYFGSENKSVRKRRAVLEAQESGKILGFTPNFLNFVDMELAKDKGKLIRSCMAEIRRFKPDVIITHHPRDKHIDHRTLGEIIPEANFQSGCRIGGGKTRWSADLILQGEVDLEMTTPFAFQVVSRVGTKNVQNKIAAFDSYSSVKDEHQTGKSWLIKKLDYRLSLRGKTVDAEFGEAFRIDDYYPVSLTGIKLLAQILE